MRPFIIKWYYNTILFFIVSDHNAVPKVMKTWIAQCYSLRQTHSPRMM